MGGGTYSSMNYAATASAKGYDSKPLSEIFQQRNLSGTMNPLGVTLREARDSAEHPNSFPIILGLDVTGSMGGIPHYLVKTGLPALMDKIIEAGIKDPQLLFMGIGDHECDQAPLQIGQFESSDQLLSKWLTELYIEQGGGGNDGESYLLAWFFAGLYTTTDQTDKRKKKGLLITIGDEPTLKQLPSSVQRKLMGAGQYKEQTATELLDKAREKYEVYHLHMLQGQGNSQQTQDGWKQLMGENVIFVQRKEDVAGVIADLVTKSQGAVAKSHESTNKKEEDML